ncbi:hypothetical protein, conserved [Eimeria maxima]|uniref:Uncharacterized protein n=1 Tax=Eimeria maxima TaxID=5804 RepID=U6M6V0_EIMMA|nr:hypothetical protein, conserved [Eimeria maxima]CDJ58788.1 hypothetical protein, conserved [Eimeria maxima]
MRDTSISRNSSSNSEDGEVALMLYSSGSARNDTTNNNRNRSAGSQGTGTCCKSRSISSNGDFSNSNSIIISNSNRNSSNCSRDSRNISSSCVNNNGGEYKILAAPPFSNSQHGGDCNGINRSNMRSSITRIRSRRSKNNGDDSNNSSRSNSCQQSGVSQAERERVVVEHEEEVEQQELPQAVRRPGVTWREAGGSRRSSSGVVRSGSSDRSSRSRSSNSSTTGGPRMPVLASAAAGHPFASGPAAISAREAAPATIESSEKQNPLLRLVAFDDLEQTFARSRCRASGRRSTNENIGAGGENIEFSRGGLEDQLLAAGISGVWSQSGSSISSGSGNRGLAGGAAAGAAPYVVQQLTSLHMGLPLEQQQQLQAATAATLATRFREDPRLEARALLELGAASNAIPTFDLFLDYRKPSGLQQHPLLQSALLLLRRLPRFALPLYDQQLLQQVCEDSALYPRLQGIEVPFRLLAHDLLFLAAYSYLSDLPPWNRPPLRLLRVPGFLLLSAHLQQHQQQPGADSGGEADEELGDELRASAAAGATSAEAADLEALDLEGASPEAMEAFHLQGLVLFNLQMILSDFHQTLSSVEILCDGGLALEDNPYAALHPLTSFLQQQGFFLHSFKYKQGSSIVSVNSSSSTSTSSDGGSGSFLTASTLQAVERERGLQQRQLSSSRNRSSNNNSSAMKAFIDACRKKHGVTANRVQQELQRQGRLVGSCEDSASCRSATVAAALTTAAPVVNECAVCTCCSCLVGNPLGEVGAAETFAAAAATAVVAQEDETSDDDSNDADGILRSHTLPPDAYSESAARDQGIGEKLASAFSSFLRALDGGGRKKRRQQQDGPPRVCIHSVLYLRAGQESTEAAAAEAAAAAAAAAAADAEANERRQTQQDYEEWQEQQQQQEQVGEEGGFLSLIVGDGEGQDDYLFSFVEDLY